MGHPGPPGRGFAFRGRSPRPGYDVTAMDDDLAEQLAARDRIRKAMFLRLSYEERLEEMGRLQRATWDLLRANPEGYAHFLRRNFKARAVDAAPGDATPSETPDAT